MVASNPELEAAVRARVDDPEAWAVYGDWLLTQGDPRGELVQLQLEWAAREDEAPIEARIDALVAEHRDAWLGEALVGRLRNDLDAWGAAGLHFTWRYGFLWQAHIKRIQHSADIDVAEVMQAVLRRPAAAFLHELSLGLTRDVYDMQRALRGLAELDPMPTVRRLFVGDFEIMTDAHLSQVDVGPLAVVGRAFPELRWLEVQGRAIGLDDLALPGLETLVARTHALPAAAARAVTARPRPALRTLELWLGDPEAGGTTTVADLEPLLAGEATPRLDRLGVMNAAILDDLVTPLATSRLLPRLRELDLSMGTLTEVGADALIEHGPAFAHLSRLNLDENLLPEFAKARLQEVFGDRVSTRAQRPTWHEPLVAIEA